MESNRREVLLVGAAALAPVSAARAENPQSMDMWRPPAWYHNEALRVSWHLLRDIDGGMNGEDSGLFKFSEVTCAIRRNSSLCQ